MRALTAIVGFLAVIFLSTRAAAFDSLWEASSGARPDSACPPWIAAIGDSLPVLSSGSMRIRTTACSRNTHYRQQAPDFQISGTLVVEARLRLESRGECVGPCGHYRDGASINITTASQVGTIFFVGMDEIFIPNGECAGINSVLVDTNDSAHTYRIEVTGAGVVTVYYDGLPVLNGHTYTSASEHGSVARILWGEASSLAYGTAHWEFVRHNAHATGCVPTSVGSMGGGASLPVNSFAEPNPFSSETTLHYSLPDAGPVSIVLFDVSGRCVRHLLDADASPGDHHVTWDGLDAGGRSVTPGPYFYRIATAEGKHTGRIVRLQ